MIACLNYSIQSMSIQPTLGKMLWTVLEEVSKTLDTNKSIKEITFKFNDINFVAKQGDDQSSLQKQYKDKLDEMRSLR